MVFPPFFCSIPYDTRGVIRPHDVLITQGIEPHPGPIQDEASGRNIVGDQNGRNSVTIDFINCTHAWEHCQQMACRDAHAFFFCEHSCSPFNVGQCLQEWRGYGWAGIMSGLDPELKHQTGGVGGMVRSPFRIFTMPPISPKLQSLIHNGRIGLYGCDIGGCQHAIVFVVYGWTGGHQDDWAANRTDGLIECILDEVQFRPPTQPILLVGDLNCTPDRLPHLQGLISDFSFVDLGAKASVWGGYDCETTCIAPNATAGSRSDFMLCNPAMVPLVQNFKVLGDDAFPVHKVLRLSISVVGCSQRNTCNKVPPSMEAHITKIFEDSIKDEDLSNVDRTDRWKMFLERFQGLVSQHLDQSWFSFHTFCSVGDTTSAYLSWSRSIENAFLEFCKIPDTACKMHIGRGQPNFVVSDQSKPPIFKKTTKSSLVGTVHIEQGRLAKQYRRLRDWNARLHKWEGRVPSASSLCPEPAGPFVHDGCVCRC